MTKKNLNHSDCANYIPIDVAKGFCRLSNKKILLDGEVCPNFVTKAKCKNCANFKNPDKDNIGTCAGLEKESWTFGDLVAVTCEGYKAK